MQNTPKLKLPKLKKVGDKLPQFDISKKFKYIPKDKRKKILLICDDIRVHSGVATIAREMVINTSQHFNWVQIAGAIKHPEKGKRFDLSDDTNTNAKINDSSVVLYPVDGYGNADLVRQLIAMEKPDAIMIFTDPRYFEWLFMIENEIRKQIPIIYLNIWDDYPTPLYNKSFYESCDALLAISKQTKLINELVLDDKAKSKVIEYVPHGLNHNIYYPLESESDLKEFEQFKNHIFGGKEKADKCCLILHTEVSSEHGTNLEAVRKILFKDYPEAILFSQNKLGNKELNFMYNLADAQILLTSNEGWGLTLTEAILAGTPIIANVTGGMQDQMGFEDEDGNWYEPSPKIPSNHTGRYTKHGSWAFPVFPTSRSLQGSPKTPYIWDDRCNPEDATIQIEKLYEMGREERKRLGKEGREWAVEKVGFTSEAMAERMINTIDKLFNTWTPREKYELINVNEVKEDTINHELLY